MLEVLERQVPQTLRARTEMVLLLLDVDHFKSVNDQNGHTAGDEALRIVAAAVRSALRTGDLVGRWGGEEFLVVLAPTSPEGAIEVAERIRATVEATAMPFIRAGRCTVSIGLARVAGGDVDHALTAADTALYEAKAEGRNCVRVASS
jgi:diguanylate cyclase (GGDEF)-like protein